MEIEFDPVKDEANRAKHGVPLAAGALVWNGEYIEVIDDRADYGETRFIAIGPIAEFGGGLYSVAYTWRGANRRIISVRRASAREAREYRRRHP